MDINPDSVQEDGEYDSQFGKHKTVEKIETKTNEEDGVEECHITQTIKQKDRWKFPGLGAGYDKIDWSK